MHGAKDSTILTPITQKSLKIKYQKKKNTRHLFQMIYFAAAKSLQSCPTLCDPIDGSPPGSPVPGILQARTLEWVAISFSSIYYRKPLNKIEMSITQLDVIYPERGYAVCLYVWPWFYCLCVSCLGMDEFSYWMQASDGPVMHCL